MFCEKVQNVPYFIFGIKQLQESQDFLEGQKYCSALNFNIYMTADKA